MTVLRARKVMRKEAVTVSKLDARQTGIVMIVLVVVVIFAAYRFGYTPISEKTAEVAEENKVLEAKLSELEYVRDNAEQFRARLNEAIVGTEDIKNRFAAGITSQKSIMMVRELETAADMDVEGISFNEVENIFTASFTNEAGEPIVGNRGVFTIDYTTSYEGLKKSMDFINGYSDYMNLESLSCSYNQETGLLKGSMSINRYSVTGLGKEYQDPPVDGIGLSNDNIFSTIR